ncbi:CoA-transferase [Rhodococcus wratislaviensis]|uniref:Putative CoA-transferase beta subunit n=1 Tax=Rhodococcus wratislaviensis NBRC 100605 TaxID=1219028 RepID=X0Q822_RHOWR|nr:CoA-transferase [Rhodococcus wratislaviensis]GAF47612.1 putative CoA-transferase beta subunit [Rhodococcus wratislaviensis NBRC 100605]
MELSARERMCIAISRELRDGEVVLTGAASAIPLAAGLLAQARHAPGLTILGAGVYINPRRLVPEFSAGWNCNPVAIADMADVFAITEQGIDVMFYGGMQIDRHGNVNVHYVNTSTGRMRGPGMANTALGHTAKRTLLFTERHDRRTLVDEVEYASVIGHSRRGRSRNELGLSNKGPSALFTPEAVFRPDPAGRLQPAAKLGDRSWASVLEAVSWEVAPSRPDDFTPTPDEIALLREHVDPGGLLRRISIAPRASVSHSLATKGSSL